MADDNNIMQINDHQLYTDCFTKQTMNGFQDLLYQLFTASWATHLNEHKTKLLNNKLQRYATAAIETKTTDDVARQLNSEPTVDPTTLKDLIKQNVEKETKALKEKIKRLEQQSIRSSKNDQRGDKGKRRASLKKKSNNTPTKPVKRMSPRKQRQSTPQQTTKRTKHSAKKAISPSTHKPKRRNVATAGAADQDSQPKKRNKTPKKASKKTGGTNNKQQTK
jgi:hypothetical protein